MRSKVWFEVCPGVGLRAVATKHWYGYQVLYRDVDGRCYREYLVPGLMLIPRT